MATEPNIEERLEKLIRTEVARLSWRQLWIQVGVQVVAYGSVFLFWLGLARAIRRVEGLVGDVEEQVSTLPEWLPEALQEAARGVLPF